MGEIDRLIDDCCKYVDSFNQELSQTKELTPDLKYIFLKKISKSVCLLEEAQNISDVQPLTKLEGKVGNCLDLFAKYLLLSQSPAVPKEKPKLSLAQTVAITLEEAEERYVEKGFILNVAELEKKKFEKKSSKLIKNLWVRIVEREKTLEKRKWTFGLFEGDKLTGDEILESM